MPGTPEEYTAGDDYARAADAISSAIAEGETDGNSILQSLDSQGLRLYSDETMGGEPPMEEPPMEEGPAAMDMGEPPMEPPPEDMGEGPSMAGSPTGRDELMDAVRFGMEKDLQKKKGREEEMAEYA